MGGPSFSIWSASLSAFLLLDDDVNFCFKCRKLLFGEVSFISKVLQFNCQQVAGKLTQSHRYSDSNISFRGTLTDSSSFRHLLGSRFDLINPILHSQLLYSLSSQYNTIKNSQIILERSSLRFELMLLHQNEDSLSCQD